MTQHDFLMMDGREHQWDAIRAKPTSLSSTFLNGEIGAGSAGVHESLLRSWHVLDAVKAMLERGDSPETVALFIAWAEARYVGEEGS